MPTLTITKSYADGDILLEADLDDIRSSITTWANTTKLDSDNLQNDGVQATKINCDESTIDGTGASLKVKDNGITNDQLATSGIFQTVPVGAVTMFHTFNGTVSIPRGWMQLNADVVNEANYNAIHGAGTYTTDGVSASSLLNKNLPNMAAKFPVGAATTTQDGTSAITYAGNASNQVDLSHTHTGPSHSHQWKDTVNAGGAANAIAYDSVADRDYTWDASNSTFIMSQGTDGFTNKAGTGATGSGGSTTQDIQPHSCEFIYIMRVI